MLEIDGHVIYEKLFDEITTIVPVKESQDFEKQQYPEMKKKPWFFYFKSVNDGGESFRFKTKKEAEEARQKFIKAKMEYDREKVKVYGRIRELDDKVKV